MSTSSSTPNQSSEQSSAVGCLLRMFWMVGGNAVLIFSAITVAMGRGLSFGIADAVFASALIALLVARYVDIQFYKGHDSTGAASTIADWRRYALSMSGVWVLIGAVAHGIAHLRG